MVHIRGALAHCAYINTKIRFHTSPSKPVSADMSNPTTNNEFYFIILYGNPYMFDNHLRVFLANTFASPIP